MNRGIRFFISLIFLLAMEGALQSQPQQSVPEEQVKIQLPGNPVAEVLNVYEILTGKRLIRDANLAGPNLSIQVAHPLSKQEAISLLEAALLLNGYTIVPVDENTSKILGSTKTPSTEGAALYAQESELPTEERVVSYFMPLRYLPALEAIKIFTPYATIRSFGSIIAVPNANALVITENTPFIRRLIALQRHIDVPGRKMLTEFVALKRADAERVAEIVNELIAEDTKEGGAVPTVPNDSPSKENAGTAKPDTFLPTPKVRVKADVRTNRIVVIAPESKMGYLRKLIQEMDVAVDLEEPLERRLQFVSAGDVLPILSNILSEGDKDKDAAQSLQNLSNTPGSSGGGGGGSGIASKPDKLQAPNENTAPMSIVVGKSRLIADRNSNKIIVIGPPEARRKAKRILDMMDERPKQIFLATIIGQLTLGNGVEAGVDYLVKFDQFRALGPGPASGISNLLQSRRAGVDILPDTANIVNGAVKTASKAAQTVLPAISGLTMYGTVADTLDVYVRALQSTNRFRVLARPMVFTTNNKKAVILSGHQVPVPRNTLTTALNTGANGSAVTATIDYKDVVLKLEVIPLVNSNDEVTLTIAQQNDTLEGNKIVGENEVPVIGTQELTTTVTVRNREVVVLGGLITKEQRNLRTGVPLLKDVPGVGYLFGTTKKDFTRRELIIFIQPLVINQHSDLTDVNALERSMTDFKGDLLQEFNQQPQDDKPPKKGKKKIGIVKSKKS